MNIILREQESIKLLYHIISPLFLEYWFKEAEEINTYGDIVTVAENVMNLHLSSEDVLNKMATIKLVYLKSEKDI